MESYITKQNFFMSMAFLTARRSKDPSTQCGAVIVNQKSRIIGTGYNGFPNGCKRAFPWKNAAKSNLDMKYMFVVHAEVNAVLNSTSDTDRADMYTTLFPCNECAKVIIQAGIKKVYYASDKYHDREFSVAARLLFDAAGVQTISHVHKKFEFEFEV